MNLNEYKKTIELLNEANDAYYVLSVPIMEDKTFDRLLDEVTEYEKEHPENISIDSPVKYVGSDLTVGFKKVEHKFPMLSIGKITTFEEVKKFLDDTDKKVSNSRQLWYICELKYDGMSLSITYDYEKLSRAVSRGDGVIGDDITQAALVIESIPKKIKTDSPRVEVRGECLISRENFKIINEDLKSRGEKLYENPRNLVSGSMKQKDSKETAKRKIDFIAYSIVEGTDLNSSHSDDLDQLENWGFRTSMRSSPTSEYDEMIEFINKIGETKQDLEYESDGVVIKLDHKDLYKSCGGTSKVPHWVKAFKFQSEEAIVKLEEVTLHVGRTGVVTPKAWFGKGVRLAGTTVVKCTLHNFDEILRLGIAIGDMVVITKKNEIIPKCTRLHEKGENRILITPPTECPVCQGEVKRIDDEVFYRCMNPDCEAKNLKKFSHFVSKGCLDIDGLSIKTLEKILDSDLPVKDFADLYDLTEKDLLSLGDGFGEKGCKNIVSAIQKSKSQGLKRVLNGLQIPGCSDGTSGDLANHFQSIDKLMEATVEELQSIEGIKNRAFVIKDFFEDEENQTLVQKLKDRGVKMTIDKKKSGGSLEGLNICVTGKLEHPRDHYTAIIEANGGKFVSSVSKTTNYLLAGSDCGSKLEKAEKLGVPVIDEAEFTGMVANW